MYRTPSSRKKKKTPTKLNLIPILDSVFIFIFFLLMSANFVQLFEITSDIPIVSDSPPPKENKKPLALTLKVDNKGFRVYKGIPSSLVKTIKKKEDKYDLESLHNFMISMKKNNINENQIILEPLVDLEYGKIVDIMDSVRLLRDSDETLFKNDKNGLSVRVNTLFNNIIFGNTL